MEYLVNEMRGNQFCPGIVFTFQKIIPSNGRNVWLEMEV